MPAVVPQYQYEPMPMAASPIASTPIVLPAEQAPDLWTVPGQMAVVFGNAGVTHLENADPARVNKVLQQFQRTNSLALNQRYWGSATDRRELMTVPEAEGRIAGEAPIKYAASSDISGALKQLERQSTNSGVLTVTSWGPQVPGDRGVVSQGAKPEFEKLKADALAANDWTVSNALPGAEPAMTLFADQNIALNYKTVTNSVANNSGKVPILGDMPALGRAFESESKLADQNGDFQTGLTREDVNGLRYLYTNAVVASQPVGGDVLAWGAVTNAAAGLWLDVARSQAAFAGPSSFERSINGGVVADNNGTQVGGTIRGEDQAEKAMRSKQDSPLMTRENQTWPRRQPVKFQSRHDNWIRWRRWFWEWRLWRWWRWRCGASADSSPGGWGKTGGTGGGRQSIGGAAR